jgi:hypothetical protein
LKKRTKLGAAFAAAALMTIVMPFGPSVAQAANETHFEVEYSDTHECTHEQVTGDLRVHYTTQTTNNSDGTTTVVIKQHAHGSHLEGVFSADEYMMNEVTDTEETFVLNTSAGGIIETRTVFIHKGEELAFTEVPGLDDLHQRLTFAFLPIGDPELVMEDTDCR